MNTMPAPATADNRPEATLPSSSDFESRMVVIRASHGWVALSLAELWEYRELLYFLTWRDIKVRYKQTVLGAAWAVIQPFFMMVVFTIFFGRLARLPSDGFPYPVFAFSALVAWTYFATALTQSANSLVDNARLITRVYFPRLLVPLAAVLAGLVDLAIALVVLTGLLLFYRVSPTRNMLALPFLALLAALTALAAGLWLSALNVKYRDVRYTIPFLIQFWLFATPVAYSSSLVPERWRALFGLNPMTGVVEGFRWALLGESPAFAAALPLSVLVVAVTLVGGLYFFRRTEKGFADVV
jgi:lipopolysaccharide transport system permease protein